MKHILTEWRRYITEARENYFDHNVDKLVLAFESSPNDIDTTVYYYEFADKDDFKNFLKNIGADKVLSQYKIKNKLGHGAVGFAFSLEDPHQDYVLKFQMSDRTYGSEYLKDVYEKQEKGEFKPNELRVLEAFDHKHKFGGSTATICVFVMSKVSMENIGGKSGKTITSDEAFREMEKVWAINALEHMATLRNLYDQPDSPQVQEAIKNTLKYLHMNSGMRTDQFNKLVHIFKSSTIENVAKYFYGEKKDKFEHLSRDQFVGLFKEIYEQMLSSVKAGRSVDLHGGNFGFRPKSDVPISFDI